jgi:hypothetical protein
MYLDVRILRLTQLSSGMWSCFFGELLPTFRRAVDSLSSGNDWPNDESTTLLLNAWNCCPIDTGHAENYSLENTLAYKPYILLVSCFFLLNPFYLRLFFSLWLFSLLVVFISFFISALLRPFFFSFRFLIYSFMSSCFLLCISPLIHSVADLAKFSHQTFTHVKGTHSRIGACDVDSILYPLCPPSPRGTNTS